MAFEKARQLVELVIETRNRHQGISKAEVMSLFAVSERTAQRMLRVLEDMFDAEPEASGTDGVYRWKVPQPAMEKILTFSADDFAALEAARKLLEKDGKLVPARQLLSIQERLQASLRRDKRRRIETDLEAMMEATGFIARPGPRADIDQDVLECINTALKACFVLSIVHRKTGKGPVAARLVEPYGIIYGNQPYLVAVPQGATLSDVRYFRLDRIEVVELTKQVFARDETFSLQDYAKRSFGVFQNDDEYDEVVWRFTPEAASAAQSYVFHPDQVFEHMDDGSLIVRFHASGHLEMAWYLYAWGDKVEVLSPARLRDMVHPWRRDDFQAFP